MFTADLKIFAVGLLACGFGENYNLDTRKAFDLNGEEVGDPLARASCLWDRVLLGLMDWMRENHPHIPIIGVCISPSYVWEGIKYTNSFHTGFPVRWKDGPAGHATELRAIPGQYLKLSNNRRSDFVTCDRLDANLSALLGTKIYEWPKDVWHYNQQAFQHHLIDPSAKLVHAEHYEPGDYMKHTTARCVHRYTLHASV
ncbi:hypothetical protein BD779DRAFT_1679253 [Infundibulicybe gibba]|nr:hypothetical protein BD779DRAFT_1679253 [Infundibulicybe gibba]